MYKKQLKFVESEIKIAAKGYKPVVASYYNSEFFYLGAIPIPKQREIHKNKFSFEVKAEKEQIKIWDYVWKNSNYFEVLNQALIFFERYKNQLNTTHWEVLKSWSKKIDNWAHGDSLCSYYAELNEKYPKVVMPTLKIWNKSKHPWLRRLSVVSLFYYSSLRKERQVSFNTALAMIKPLLNDKHFYVQKAYGWTLREMYNVYPEQTFKYLKKISANIPPAGWQAATEKLTKNEKTLLKKLRAR